MLGSRHNPGNLRCAEGHSTFLQLMSLYHEPDKDVAVASHYSSESASKLSPGDRIGDLVSLSEGLRPMASRC